MRCFLTIVCLFFIAQSSFAAKSVDKKATYHAAIKKRISLFHYLLKTDAGDHTHVSKDYFEYPTLNRQDIKKIVIHGILLFQHAEHEERSRASVKTYNAHPRLNYIFIQQCLYPKHVFW